VPWLVASQHLGIQPPLHAILQSFRRRHLCHQAQRLLSL
jgi:hypothetical protein